MSSQTIRRKRKKEDDEDKDKDKNKDCKRRRKRKSDKAKDKECKDSGESETTRHDVETTEASQNTAVEQNPDTIAAENSVTLLPGATTLAETLLPGATTLAGTLAPGATTLKRTLAPGATTRTGTLAPGATTLAGTSPIEENDIESHTFGSLGAPYLKFTSVCTSGSIWSPSLLCAGKVYTYYFKIKHTSVLVFLNY